MNTYKLIGPFKQVLPMTGLPLNGALKDEQLNVLEGKVGILLQGETIAYWKLELPNVPVAICRKE